MYNQGYRVLRNGKEWEVISHIGKLVYIRNVEIPTIVECASEEYLSKFSQMVRISDIPFGGKFKRLYSVCTRIDPQSHTINDDRGGKRPYIFLSSDNKLCSLSKNEFVEKI